METLKLSRKSWLFAAVATAITFLCYLPSLQNGFVNWDDWTYILENPLIRDFSFENTKEIFLTPQYNSLYHPLTLFSYSIDFSLGGDAPYVYHLHNLLLHLVNTILVFMLLKSWLKRDEYAFLGALIFSLHPMHIESVAWISARKDVLYGMFFLMGLLAYRGYQLRNYTQPLKGMGLAGLLMVLSLLSKGLAFTFPLVLFLMDYWEMRKDWRRALFEKIPLILIAAGFAFFTFSGQDATGSVDEAPVFRGIIIAAFTSLNYLGKFFFPFSLSAYHPYPETSSWDLPWFYYLAFGFWVLLGILLFLRRKNARWAVFGILFLILTMAPVLQLIPFGKTIISERYTYIPYVGLSVSFLWGLKKLEEWKNLKWPVFAGIAMGVCIFGGITFNRTSVWKNSETLWGDVLEKYPETGYALKGRGAYRLDHQDLAAARQDLEQAVIKLPHWAEAHYELGRLREAEGMPEKAAERYRTAIALDSADVRSRHNLGMIHARQGDLETAEKLLAEAIRIQPDYALAHLNMGVIHESTNQMELALRDYETALRLEPWNPVFYRYRAVWYLRQEQFSRALADLDQALALNPGYGNAWYLRSKTAFNLGNPQEAKANARRAQELGYDLGEWGKQLDL